EDGNPVPAFAGEELDEQGNIALGNGAVVDLAPGEKANAANPSRPNANFDPFFVAVVKQIGAALELPLDELMLHYQASYSAARAAMLQAWRFYTARRWVLVFAWTEGLRRAVLAAVGARAFIPLTLLATERGRPYTGDGFRTLWHRAMGAALEAGDLRERFTFNDLRAKAGSESRDWKLLGHMDVRTFERVYNRLPRQVTPSR